MPLPFMLGAMIAVTIAALAQTPMKAPANLRKIVVPILGVMLGSGFSPETFDRAGDWGFTLLALPVFIAVAFGGTFIFYRAIGRYDAVTAFYSSAPGGLTEMFMLGDAAGGDARRIAMAHSSRILIVVSFVALFYGLVLDISATGDARPYVTFADVPISDLAILAACAVAGAWIGARIGLPAAPILGPMALSAIVHLAGLTDAPPPSFLVNGAQVVMGSVIGARFLGSHFRAVACDMALAFGACTIMISAALVTAYAVTATTGIGLEQTFLTFSPGGLPEMSLLALSMNADIAYVATIHILRIAFVISIAPVIFQLLKVTRR